VKPVRILQACAIALVICAPESLDAQAPDTSVSQHPPKQDSTVNSRLRHEDTSVERATLVSDSTDITVSVKQNGADSLSGAGDDSTVYTDTTLNPSPADSIQTESDTARPAAVQPDSLIDSLSADTARDSAGVRIDGGDSVSAGSDSVAYTDSILEAADSSDTISLLANRHFLGIGFGWTLGNFPLVTLWEQSLPDSLARLGLEPVSIVTDFSDTAQLDTVELRLEENDIPDAYHMTLPVLLSYHLLPDSTRSIYVYGSGSFIRKSYNASIHTDTTDNRVTINKSFLLTSFFLGATYHQRIPERYFTVTDMDRTFFTLGIGASPAIFYWKRGSVSLNASSSKLLSAIRDSISFVSEDIRSRGYGISWLLGMSFIRGITPKAGIQSGIYYGGNFMGWFRSEGNRVRVGSFDPRKQDADSPVQSISHSIMLRVQVIRRIGPQPVE
jgi:hypothetical protein